MPVSLPSGARLTPPRLMQLYGTEWADYTPIWTGTTTNPVVGDGSVTGRWCRSGPIVHVTGRVLIGSTTTLGSGEWRISLPVNAANGTMFAGTALIYDASSGAARRAGAVWLAAVGQIKVSADGEVGPATPFVWAASDQIRWSFSYESV